MRRVTVMVTFCIVLKIAAFAQPDEMLENFIKENKVPGIFVAVVRGDSVLYHKALGVADKANGVPLTPTTCMELGSISKVFTAETIYYLHYKGLLNIQDPIRKYLAAAPPSWSDITI